MNFIMEVSNPDNKTLKSILKGTVIALITTIILFFDFFININIY